MAKAKVTKQKAGAPKQPAAKKKPAEVSNASAKKKAERKPAKPQVLLTTEQRRKLLKPREGFDDLIERVARTWENTRSLRVPGQTIQRLRKLLRDAQRAATREELAREKLERTLRPLYDGRLLAEDKAWRALLDVNAAVKLFARSDPSLIETFGFLTDALTSNPSGSRSSAGPAETEATAPDDGAAEAQDG